jgi:hypothetical protein
MMKMKWSKAFKGALKTILYSIVWYFLGYALFLGGISYIFSNLLSYMNYLSPMHIPDTVNRILLGWVMAFFGMIIILIRTLASFYKVFAELLAEEIKGG